MFHADDVKVIISEEFIFFAFINENNVIIAINIMNYHN